MSSDSVWPEYDERTQAMVDAMVESEERALAARKEELEDCDCKEGMFPSAGRPASRRSFLAATAAMAGGTTLGLAAGGASAEAPPGAIEFPVPTTPPRSRAGSPTTTADTAPGRSSRPRSGGASRPLRRNRPGP